MPKHAKCQKGRFYSIGATIFLTLGCKTAWEKEPTFDQTLQQVTELFLCSNLQEGFFLPPFVEQLVKDLFSHFILKMLHLHLVV